MNFRDLGHFLPLNSNRLSGPPTSSLATLSRMATDILTLKLLQTDFLNQTIKSLVRAQSETQRYLFINETDLNNFLLTN